MNILELLLISISLAVDCFAVSVANGVTSKKIKIQNALKTSFSFGLFQAIMPIIGWFIGSNLKNTISSLGHWVAFVLLSSIGIKMLFEASQKSEENKISLSENKTLFLQSIATSIDALIIGTSFALLNFPIFTSAATIGLITFFLSLTGVFIGEKIGNTIDKKAEIAGGLILIGIGLKILITHIF